MEEREKEDIVGKLRMAVLLGDLDQAAAYAEKARKAGALPLMEQVKVESLIYNAKYSKEYRRELEALVMRL